jgi:AcrR family transcriptional regulator
VTARGDRTRERILDAAEQVFGERGVEAVTMRQIQVAAGQRNRSALQFHFGGRDGLLLALAERHLPRVAAIQEGLEAELVPEDRPAEPATLVEVLVRPYAEYVRAGPGARAWLRIAAEGTARPERGVDDFIDHAPSVALRTGTALYEHLSTTMPGDVAAERILGVSQVMLHLCADRARIEDAPARERGRLMLDFDAWIDNLLDMAAAAMLAPAGRRLSA